MGLTKPSRTILSTIDFSKAFDSVWHSALFHKLISASKSLFAFLVGLNLSFLIGVLAWFFSITKVVPFEFVEVFRNDPFLALYFFLFSSMISCISAFFRQLLSLLTIWPFGPPFPLGPCCGGGHTRSSVSIGALV